ncbi:MAG: glycosyltransferase [Bacteroidota bacterium]
MKYLLQSIGTRGDMEPFLAIGRLLADRGHQVTCAMPEQFRELVADADLGFEPFDKRFLELIDGEVGRAIMGQKGSAWHRLRLLWKLSRESLSLQRVMMQEQRDYVQKVQPDRIIYHPKCLFGRIWGMAHPKQAFGLSPIPNWLHEVDNYPHIAINTDLGKRGNLFSYRFINYFVATMTAKYGRPFKEDFPGLKINRRSVAKHMREAEQVMYLISPSLFPQPQNWPGQANVLGYHERKKTNHWAPEAGLLDFLERMNNQDITFGSMVNADPAGKTKAVIEVLTKHNIPAIINTSSGGLLRQDDIPDHIHFVSSIPYEWIFPKMHSVVHHGGSGTTHTAVKHGCANLIIPHIVDQFFWNRRIRDLGLGPLGVKVKKLNTSSFEPLLLELRGNASYRKTAHEFGERLRRENFNEKLLAALEK